MTSEALAPLAIWDINALERELKRVIAEGGDATDILNRLDYLRSDEADTAAFLLAGQISQDISEREAHGARVETRDIYLDPTAAWDWDDETWSVRIRVGRRRYLLTLPVDGATRYVLFQGNLRRGRMIAGKSGAASSAAVAEWVIAAVLADCAPHRAI